jgi:hypothetical protein
MNTEEDCKLPQCEGEDCSQNFDPNHNKSPEGLPNKVDSKKVTVTPEDSGLYLYVDLHGHASKKGLLFFLMVYLLCVVNYFLCDDVEVFAKSSNFQMSVLVQSCTYSS